MPREYFLELLSPLVGTLARTTPHSLSWTSSDVSNDEPRAPLTVKVFNVPPPEKAYNFAPLREYSQRTQTPLTRLGPLQQDAPASAVGVALLPTETSLDQTP
jgi:hypothetical protein